jgi:hypothetical protein
VIHSVMRGKIPAAWGRIVAVCKGEGTLRDMGLFPLVVGTGDVARSAT